MVYNFCFSNSVYNKANIFLCLIKYELNSLLGASHLVDYISVHIRFDLERYLLNIVRKFLSTIDWQQPGYAKHVADCCQCLSFLEQLDFRFSQKNVYPENCQVCSSLGQHSHSTGDICTPTFQVLKYIFKCLSLWRFRNFFRNLNQASSLNLWGYFFFCFVVLCSSERKCRITLSKTQLLRRILEILITKALH